MSDGLKRALLVVCAIVLAGCAVANSKQGTLSGHVTIGPLQPVLREGETESTPSPQVYAAWQVVVYSEDGQEVARATIDSTGNYEVSLPAHTYAVTAEPVSGGRGPGGSPTYDVEIIPSKVTHLDLDIDTGIR